MPDAARASSADLRRGPRWLRSVRRRPSAFVSLVVLSALAVVVSVLMPMLLRATQAVSLAESVAAADFRDTHLVGVGLVSNGNTPDASFSAVDEVTSALRTPNGWDAAVDAGESTDSFPWALPDGRRLRAWLSLAKQACPGVPLTTGHCPENWKEGLFAASAARGSGVRVGSTVVLNPGQGPFQHAVKIVGLYDDRSAVGRVLARPAVLDGDPVARPVPALVIGVVDADMLGDWTIWSARRLANPVTLDELPSLQQDLRAAESATLSDDNAEIGGRVQSGVSTLLARIAADGLSAAIVTTAIALEALVLAWFALAAVLGRISRGRAAEWGIGRTRGVPRWTWLAAVFLEPTVAVLLGAAAGFAGGVGLAVAAARAMLGRGADVEPLQPLVLAAAGLALAGSLAAIVAASVRSARLPIPALLRETTEPRQLSRIALVAQVGVVLIAAVALWVTLTQEQTGVAQVALLTPALIAIVVALAALRIAVLVVRRGTARPSRSLAGLVVGRRLARAPSVLTSAVLVAVGVALTAYTLQLALVADRLSVAQAQAAVGAATVLDVSGLPSGALVSAVHAADPSGRVAMAAAELAGTGVTSTDRVVAVDTSRLAAVTTWRSAWRGSSPGTIASRLDPSHGADLVLRGTRLSVTIGGVGDGQLEGVPAPNIPQIQLSVVVATQRGWVTVKFGDLRNGTLRSTSGAFPCSGGCRLVSIGVADPAQVPAQPYGVTFDLAAIATDQQPASTFADWTSQYQRWRPRISDDADPSFDAKATVEPGALGVEFVMDDQAGDLTPDVEPAVGPEELPALRATDTATDGFAGLTGVVFGTGFTRSPLLLRIVGTAPVLPRSLQDGVLVDLGQMTRFSDPGLSAATQEVWLAPGSHPAVLARLRAAGVKIGTVQHLDAAVVANERRAPPLAIRLALITAGAAILLTLLALVCTRIAGAPGTRRDWRTLRDTGVGSRVLRRLAALDAIAPATAGALLGVLAGTAGYLVTVQRLPLLPAGVGNPPPDWSPDWVAAGVLALAVVLVVAVIGLVGSRLEIRRDAR